MLISHLQRELEKRKVRMKMSSFSQITDPTPNPFVLGALSQELTIQLTQVTAESIFVTLPPLPREKCFSNCHLLLCLCVLATLQQDFLAKSNEGRGLRGRQVSDKCHRIRTNEGAFQCLEPTCSLWLNVHAGHFLPKNIYLKDYLSCPKYKQVQDGNFFFFLCP